MENATSNYVEALESGRDKDDPDSGGKQPITLLLNQLLTNAEIVDILESDYDINIKSVHPVEVDIYVKIIKKYLKDWPEWKELERMPRKVTNKKDFDAVSEIFKDKYNDLKVYLGVMLEAGKTLAIEALKSITTKNAKIEENIDINKVVMKIQCTVRKLNHLVFTRPQSDINYTIFNILPPIILLKGLTFEEILGAGWVKIYIDLPNFTYVQEAMYILKHGLVNKVSNENTTKDISLNTNLQRKVLKNVKNYTKHEILKQVNDILKECLSISFELFSLMKTVFDILRQQLDNTYLYKIPGIYRKFANKYKYVRYLYAENENSNDTRYKLLLEEVLSPAYQFYIGKIGELQKPLLPLPEWFKIECIVCKKKFTGNVSIKEAFQVHFNDHYQEEPEWQCMHCKRLFKFKFLTKNYWAHECEAP